MSEIKLVTGETVKDIRITVFAGEQGYPEAKLFDDKENSADFLACFDAGDISVLEHPGALALADM